MTKQAKMATIVLSVAVAIGLIAAFVWPVIYRDFIATPAADAPSVSAPSETSTAPEIEGTGETLSEDEFTGEWKVSAGSEAGYRVDEVLNGTDVTVTGRTSEVSGSATIDSLTLSAATIEIDVATIATDSRSRDNYFRNDAMRVSEHPTATFTLTDPVTASAAPVSGEVAELEVTGDLTLAGVTQSVTFTTEWLTDGTTARVAGAIPIVFEDFGVTAPNLGFVRVEPEGFVEFSLVLTR